MQVLGPVGDVNQARVLPAQSVFDWKTCGKKYLRVSPWNAWAQAAKMNSLLALRSDSATSCSDATCVRNRSGERSALRQVTLHVDG